MLRISNPAPFPAVAIQAAAAAATRPQPRRIPPRVLHCRRPTQATLSSATSLQALRHAAPRPLVLVLGGSPTQQKRNLSSSSSLAFEKMATDESDEQYMAFLDKANRDADDARATAARAAAGQGSRPRPPPFRAMDAGSEVPRVIQEVIGQAVYVSEADEPFDGVSLRWIGEGLPDEDEFAELIHHWDPPNAEIDIMDPTDWDREGQYVRIIDAVREATRGNDVRVYRVVKDASRVEYWMISRDDSEGRVVGVKALGVES